eukprot:3297365-Amphidinium_carterae.1
METPVSKRKTLVGCAFDADMSEVKRPRIRKDVSVAAQVKKALYDHCRAWSKYQKEILRVEG